MPDQKNKAEKIKNSQSKKLDVVGSKLVLKFMQRKG